MCANHQVQYCHWPFRPPRASSSFAFAFESPDSPSARLTLGLLLVHKLHHHIQPAWMAVEIQPPTKDPARPKFNVHRAGFLLKGKMSHDNKPFLPLAPGLPRMFAPPSTMTVGKPKKNSTACLACKSAKRKVCRTGQRPFFWMRW